MLSASSGGIDLIHMPKDLQKIDEIINDRKLLISEMSERVKEFE